MNAKKAGRQPADHQKKLIVEMLRIMDRYQDLKSSLDLFSGRSKNPLQVSFDLRQEKPDNLRTHQRVCFAGEVNINKSDQYIVGNCLNISASGLYVSCDPHDEVQVNDMVHLIIKLRDNAEIFRTAAKVTRQDRSGYALKFVTT